MTSAIRLATGSGTARQLADGATVDFVPLKDQHTDTPAISNAKLAEMVEIELNVEQSLRLRLQRRGGGPVSAVAITADADIPTTVSFSNLCSGTHRELDEEFAGFYEVLENPPLVRERLVPRHHPCLMTEIPCFPPIIIRYRVD